MNSTHLRAGDRIVLLGYFRTPHAKLQQMLEDTGLVRAPHTQIADATALFQARGHDATAAQREITRIAKRLGKPVGSEFDLLQQLAVLPRRPKQLALDDRLFRRVVPIPSPFAVGA